MYAIMIIIIMIMIMIMIMIIIIISIFIQDNCISLKKNYVNSGYLGRTTFQECST